MKIQLVALSLSAVLLGACANQDIAQGEPAEQKYTRTGSHIPERERAGVVAASPDEFERSRATNSGTLVKDPATRGTGR
jgi:hypothetical protein